MTRNGLSIVHRNRRQGLAAATAGVLYDLALFELLEPRRLYAADLTAVEGVRVRFEQAAVEVPAAPSSDSSAATDTVSSSDTSNSADNSSTPSPTFDRWGAVLAVRAARRDAAAAALGLDDASSQTSTSDSTSDSSDTTTASADIATTSSDDSAEDFGSAAAAARTRSLFERIFARTATTAIRGEDGQPVTAVAITLPAATSAPSESTSSTTHSRDDSSDDKSDDSDDDKSSDDGKFYHHGKWVFGDFDGDGTTEPVLVIIGKSPDGSDTVIITPPGVDEPVFGQPLPGSGGAASEDGTKSTNGTTTPTPTTVGSAGVGEIVIGVIDVIPPAPGQGDSSGSFLAHATGGTGGGAVPVEFRGSVHHDGGAHRGPSGRPVDRPQGDTSSAKSGDGSDRSDAIDALSAPADDRGNARSSEKSDVAQTPSTILVTPIGMAAAVASTLKVSKSVHIAATAAEVAAAAVAGGPLAGAQAAVSAAKEAVADKLNEFFGSDAPVLPETNLGSTLDLEHAGGAIVGFLGLAPAWSQSANADSDDSSGRFWEIAATGSLIVTLAGCWYCANAPKRARRDRKRRAAGRFATGRAIEFEAVKI